MILITWWRRSKNNPEIATQWFLRRVRTCHPGPIRINLGYYVRFYDISNKCSHYYGVIFLSYFQMCVYICTYIHILYIDIHIHIYSYIHIFIYTHKPHTNIDISLYVDIDIETYTHICIKCSSYKILYCFGMY